MSHHQHLYSVEYAWIHTLNQRYQQAAGTLVVENVGYAVWAQQNSVQYANVLRRRPICEECIYNISIRKFLFVLKLAEESMSVS